MNNIEEQVEQTAREWATEGADGRYFADRLRAALLPLEVTDEGVNVPKAALAQVMAIVRLTYPVRPESLAAEAIRQCNAALTQKGDNE